MKINILGVPFNSDGTPPEKENPAKAIRDAGLITLLKSGGHIVTDYGDISIPKPEGCLHQKTGILNLSALQETSRRLAKKFKEIFNINEFSIVLGGDCAILIGIFGALAARNINAGLIFFDGHADFQIKETSQTGEAADFELSFLTGRGPEEITKLFKKYPLIPDENIVAYGLRELDLIAESNIKVFTKDKMIEDGIDKVIKEGLENLLISKKPMWLHFDVDVIDPSIMPVLIPVSNGLTFEQAQSFLVQMLSSLNFIGMSISCYHPNLDTTGEAGKKISAVISSAI